MTKDNFILELKKIGINITNDMLTKLDKYYDLLIEWNNKFNLTAITDKEEVYLKHFYDSATIIKVIDLNKNYTLCDIGTGAGFPGIVLKILFPSLNITLVDALNKRINFLDEVIKQLDLKNITAIHSRAEDFARINKEKYDIATARAVANMPTLLELSVPILKKNGYFIAMKSNVSTELENINNALNVLNCKIDNINSFNLPIENSLRTIVLIKKYDKTSNKYPRKFSDIKNRPL